MENKIMKWILIEKLLFFILNTATNRIQQQTKKKDYFKQEAERLHAEQMAKSKEAQDNAARAEKVASVLSQVT